MTAFAPLRRNTRKLEDGFARRGCQCTRSAHESAIACALTTASEYPQRPVSTYSVEKLRFQRCSKDCGPSEASFNFGRGGRRDLVLRVIKIVLIKPAAIHRGNSRLRSRLARNPDECIFEFFNRIDPKLTYAPLESRHSNRPERQSKPTSAVAAAAMSDQSIIE